MNDFSVDSIPITKNVVKKYSKRKFGETFEEILENPDNKKSKTIFVSDDMSDTEDSSDDDWDYNGTNNRSKENGYLAMDDVEDPVKQFLDKLSTEERMKLIKTEQKLKKIYNSDIPLKIQILRLNAPEEIKAKMLNKYESLEVMDTSNSEFGKLKKWMDFMLRIPWNRQVHVPVTIKDGFSVINKYLGKIQRHLNQTVYGHKGPKSAILEMIAQWIINPESRGLVLGFEGPPGTGKTSLMRHGVAYALKRPFVSISLGGARDGAFLDGSNQVFEGSTCGKIVKSLIDSKCMNPIFYFDEGDKISDSSYGAEIGNVLVHLTDPSQNYDFQDKFLETGLNLSKGVYIFSYNDHEKIDPILRDRIKRIRFEGYDVEDKINIALNYSIPDIFREWGFNKGDIIFSSEIICYIIERFTENEAGIRALVHCLEMIISKLNLFRISDNNFFKQLELSESETQIRVHQSQAFQVNKPNKIVHVFNSNKNEVSQSINKVNQQEENGCPECLEDQQCQECIFKPHFELGEDISFPLEMTKGIVDALISDLIRF